MAGCTVIILDNGIASQDQDYLPGRFLLQKEVTETAMTQVFETDGEGHVALIPLAQAFRNDILSPSRNKSELVTFLTSCDLNRQVDLVLSLFQSEHSFNSKEFGSKTLIIFLGSEIPNPDEAMTTLHSLVLKGVNVRIISFGDALDFGRFIRQELCFDNLQVLLLPPEKDFLSSVTSFLNVGIETYDPDLQEAIRRSMVEH